jgi:hypothetical protein
MGEKKAEGDVHFLGSMLPPRYISLSPLPTVIKFGTLGGERVLSVIATNVITVYVMELSKIN